ncbi:adenosylcobinamide-GDP ribazoletransferase [Shimia ponticola]|uniref:adenosylcobinamide-GDP ribazoletransferase n=1 Tax=Shimia ponticola TaxID=2582893 RepID=UPI0011BE89A8|nr:adenosylcobinamide-GDP ribazoletransferase [Shimia ponticola]
MPAGDTDQSPGRHTAFDLRDIPAALGLLTRLPFRVDPAWAMDRGARSAWAYPFAGIILGFGGVIVALALKHMSVPSSMIGLIVIAAWVFCTGALHEDGLADAFDGLWGGWDRQRRLDIMKDSRIGTYGVIALALSLAARWQGVTFAVEAGWWWALVAIPTASRCVMPALMRMPNARPGGLSSKVGAPPVIAARTALAIGALSLIPLMGAGLLVALVVAALALIVRQVAMAKIGGQTGDILGATQQLSEVGAWIVVAAVIAP